MAKIKDLRFPTTSYEFVGRDGNIPNLVGDLSRIATKTGHKDAWKEQNIARILSETIRPKYFFKPLEHLGHILERCCDKHQTDYTNKRDFVYGCLNFLEKLFADPVELVKLVKNALPKLTGIFARQFSRFAYLAGFDEAEAFYHDKRGNFRGFLVELIKNKNFTRENLDLLSYLGCSFTATREVAEGIKSIPLLFYILAKGSKDDLKVYLESSLKSFRSLETPCYGPFFYDKECEDKVYEAMPALAYTIISPNINQDRLEKIKLLIKHGANVNPDTYPLPASQVLRAFAKGLLSQNEAYEVLKAMDYDGKLDVLKADKSIKDGKSPYDLMYLLASEKQEAVNIFFGQGIVNIFVSKNPGDPARFF